MINIGWPQGIWISIAILGLLIHAAKNGEAIEAKYNWPMKVMSVAIAAALLYWGGFFSTH